MVILIFGRPTIKLLESKSPNLEVKEMLKKGSLFQKSCLVFLALVFMFNQVPALNAQGVDQSALPQELALDTPVIPADGSDGIGEESGQVIPNDELFTEGALSEATDDSKEENGAIEPLELDRYEFDRAIESLQGDIAQAIVLEDLTSSDLSELLNLDYEVGIAVLHGEIVLFTSGGENEILVQEPVLALLNEVSLVSHTHPFSTQAHGPSSGDIYRAVAAPSEEYVVSKSGVYAYNDEGPINGGVPTDFNVFIDKLNEVLENSDSDIVRARESLNEFIYQMDLLNSEETRNAEVFRRSGSQGPGGTDPITHMVGSPTPGVIQGESWSYDAATMWELSADEIEVRNLENIPTSPSTEYAVLRYTQSTGVDYTDGGAETKLVFQIKATGLKVDGSIQVRVKDGAGNEDEVELTGITSSYQQYEVPFSAFDTPSSVNFGNIEWIQFVADQPRSGANLESFAVRIDDFARTIDPSYPDTINYRTPYLTNWNPAHNWTDVQAGDFNGDGREDVIGRSTLAGYAGQWFVSLSNAGTGSMTTQRYADWNPAHNWTDVQVGDYNGDGRDDVIGRSTLAGYDGQWFVALSNVNGTATTQKYTNWNPAHNWTNVQTADVNGDGIDDVIGRSTLAGYAGNWYAAISNGSGTASSQLLTNWNPAHNWTNVMVADVNGDGRDDIVGQSNSSGVRR